MRKTKLNHMQTVHMHMSVEGALRQPAKHLKGMFTIDGRESTAAESKALLHKAAAEGKLVLPFGSPCKGFDYKGKGCPGHYYTPLQYKRHRCEIANKAIRAIASCGRRFFYSASTGATAEIMVDDRGRVWFIDDYSRKQIFTHDTAWGNKWRGFSHGGTLKDLVKLFRDYILKGEKIHHGYIGLERSYSDGNIWGYQESELAKVRELAGQLDCFTRPPKQAAA